MQPAVWLRYLISAMLLIVGVIHLLPIAGVLGPARLEALYGVAIADPSLEVLMRHRAVLFGLLGLLLVSAAFRRELQGLALIAGFVSVVSFLWLAASVGDYNDAVARVFLVDVIAVVCLTLAAAAWGYCRRR